MRLKAVFRAYQGDPSANGWTPPESLEWMPGGKQTVSATGPDGGPAKVTTNVTAEDAAALDAKLQELIAKAERGEASRPFIDFNHAGADAAAIPKQFFWDDGIRLAVEWTARGLEALKGRVYSYFSPEFLLLDGGKVDLPEVGPIGGLVNTPAYQTIERLAAKLPDQPEDKTKGNIMEDLLKLLVSAGMLPEDTKPDTKPEDVVASLKAKFEAATKATETATAEATQAKAALTEANKVVAAFAESDVAAAVADGRIDEAAKAKWLASYSANPETARAMLASIRKTTVAGHNPNDLPGKGTPKDEVKGIARVTAAFSKQRGK